MKPNDRPDTRPLMRDALHSLAEHVLRMPSVTNRTKWLKKRIAEEIVANDWIEHLDKQYRDEYPYADAPTEYLAKTLEAYDQEVA